MLQKTFPLISGLIALYALQQGHEIEIQGEIAEAEQLCFDWYIRFKENILSTCHSQANCTLFFLKYKVLTGNEWFGNFQIESRHSANESFSKFELRALYDNMCEQEIGKLPKTISNSPGFHRTDDVISFSIDKRYKNLTLGVWGPNFCGTLKLIRLFYYQCPSNTTALVNFKATLAPSKNSNSILLKGNCADNAVQNKKSSSLSMKCYHNGSYEVFGSCLCKPGFSNLDNGRSNNNCKG